MNEVEARARFAMETLYVKQRECGFSNTCCLDFGIPAIVDQFDGHIERIYVDLRAARYAARTAWDRTHDAEKRQAQVESRLQKLSELLIRILPVDHSDWAELRKLLEKL